MFKNLFYTILVAFTSLTALFNLILVSQVSTELVIFEFVFMVCLFVCGILIRSNVRGFDIRKMFERN